ncbi:hypothetical protein [Hymenobacter swuensis]|uniref:Uncharacterized protein n=1 Tax=Hymenobacter swuensis DY53 TaxID=1227739 RepID=W8F4N1_9BACT|nr:hypothetical protein [Hymenobacter swuensis]AHJ98962.1 hypothetical protein Hsw_3367 [Hymenobacter swuensis DY53]
MPAKLNTIWSTAEVAVLKNRYVLGTKAELLGLLPGRNWDCIRNKAQNLGLRRRSGESHWSPEDEQQVRAHYATRGGHYLASLLGRTHTAVLKKAAKLGLRIEEFGKQPRKTNWSEQHLTILREEYPIHGPEHVAQQVGRNQPSVVTMAKRLGIRCRRRPAGRPRWSTEHLGLLMEHYPAGLPTAQLVELLGRKADTIHAMARTLGLKRPPRVVVPKPPKVKVPEPVPAPKPAPVAKAKPAPAPKKPVLSEEEKALKKLVRQKAQAKKEKKAKPEPPKKGWQYPMHSPEYNAWLASTTAGKKATTILDENGRTAIVWRKAA